MRVLLLSSYCFRPDLGYRSLRQADLIIGLHFMRHLIFYILYPLACNTMGVTYVALSLLVSSTLLATLCT